MINDARLFLSAAAIHFVMEDNSDLQILFIASSIFLEDNTVLQYPVRIYNIYNINSIYSISIYSIYGIDGFS